MTKCKYLKLLVETCYWSVIFCPQNFQETISEIAMKWTKLLRTGSIETQFMGFDLNTVMFTMEKGQDSIEVFILLLQVCNPNFNSWISLNVTWKSILGFRAWLELCAHQKTKKKNKRLDQFKCYPLTLIFFPSANTRIQNLHILPVLLKQHVVWGNVKNPFSWHFDQLISHVSDFQVWSIAPLTVCLGFFWIPL